MNGPLCRSWQGFTSHLVSPFSSCSLWWLPGPNVVPFLLVSISAHQKIGEHICPNPVASAVTYFVIRAQMEGFHYKNTQALKCALTQIQKNTQTDLSRSTQSHLHKTHSRTHTLRYLMFFLFEAKFLLSLGAICRAPFPRFLRRVQGFHLRAIVCAGANSLRSSDILTDS